MALDDIVFSEGDIAQFIVAVGSLNTPIDIVSENNLVIELNESPHKGKIIDARPSIRRSGQGQA